MGLSISVPAPASFAITSDSLGLTRVSKKMYFTSFSFASLTISATFEGLGSTFGDKPAIDICFKPYLLAK